MKTRIQIQCVVIVLAALTCALVASTCGGHHRQTARLSQLGVGSEALSNGAEASLDEALAEIDALRAPDGVDPALFRQLQDELAKQFRARSEGRLVCTPPTGESNAVTDLALVAQGNGLFNLTWTYRNLGDYGQNGSVGIEDITPLAQHFGETCNQETEPNCIQAVIDGSGNGKVGIEDVTPIAVSFGVACGGYLLQFSDAEAGPWENSQPVARESGVADPGRLRFTVPLPGGHTGFVRVVPADDEMANGVAGNVVALPDASSQPVVTWIAPQEGVTGTDVTFVAELESGTPPGYSWSFGGGASPDSSTDTSPTVTLGAAGEYEASLTVNNDSGVITIPFNLRVTATPEAPEVISAAPLNGAAGQSVEFRAVVRGTPPFEYFWDFGDAATPARTYEESPAVVLAGAGTYPILCRVQNGFGVHQLDLSMLVAPAPPAPTTWGTAEDECIYALAVDDEGNTYAGGLISYGFSGSDVLLLKYNNSGDLVYARSWGEDWTSQAIVGIAVDPIGQVYLAVSGTSGSAELVAFDTSGTLRWGLAWPYSPDSTFKEFTGIAVDDSGNIYVTGYSSDFYGWCSVNATGYLFKVDSQGNTVFGYGWDYNAYLYHVAYFYDVAVDTSGNVFVVGEAGNSASGLTGIVLKFSGNGPLLVSREWEAGLPCYAADVTVDAEGNVFVAGAYSDAKYIYLVKYDNALSEVYRRVCFAGPHEGHFGIEADSSGQVLLAACYDNSLKSLDAMLVEFDGATGNLVSSYAWGTAGEEKAYAVAIDEYDRVHVGGYAPNSSGTWMHVWPYYNTCPPWSQPITVSPAESSTLEEFTVELETPAGVIDTGAGGQDALVIFQQN